MAENNEGKLTKTEREELRKLVKEAEHILAQNARHLANESEKSGA